MSRVLSKNTSGPAFQNLLRFDEDQGVETAILLTSLYKAGVVKMADTKTKPRPQTAGEPSLSTHKEGIANLTDMNTNLLETFGDISAHMAKFIAQRIEEDVKVQHELLHCKSLTDVQTVQLNFFEQALRQYQESAARMFDLGTHVFENRRSK